VMNPDMSGTADVVWVTEKGDSRDPFTKNHAGRTPAPQLLSITTRNYLRVVADFAKHFGKSPDKLGLNELRTYQAYLLRERKLTPGTVINQVAALRFFFVKTLKRHQFRSSYPIPKTTADCQRCSVQKKSRKTRNDSAHPRGGRHSARAGRSLSGAVSIKLWLSTAQSFSGHSTLPHGSVGRPPRCLPTLRLSDHLLQLVSKSALPQVSSASA
jgi:hypothetical protein